MVSEEEDRDDPRDEPTSREALKAKTDLETLLRSPGWCILQKWIDTQVQARTNRIMLSTDHTPNEEAFMKGEAAGLRLVSTIPASLVEYYADYMKGESDE